jgi:hypothetical protein
MYDPQWDQSKSVRLFTVSRVSPGLDICCFAANSTHLLCSEDGASAVTAGHLTCRGSCINRTVILKHMV